MLKESHARNIELGPRQIFLFDLEDKTSVDQARVRDYLTGQVEIHGQVELNGFIPSAVGALGLDAFTILQHLFWLAHDLEIHFRKDQDNVAVNEARQMLIATPKAGLQVVLNKPVDEAVFQSVKQFFNSICPYAQPDADLDQTEFARRLTRQVRQWKQDLESCSRSAGRPGFPGLKDIEDGLGFIVSTFQKLDPFSLIHSFYANIEPIRCFVEKVRALCAFYAEDASRWQMLMEFGNACKYTIAEDRQMPAVVEAYEQLKKILSLPRPYDRVDEAWQLYRLLKPRHKEISARQVKQFRKTALMRVDGLIGDMSTLLDAHGADSDMRNHALFTLRVNIRSIKDAKSIGRIKIHVQAAEEAFEAFCDEVADQ
jgi:hypothetical protein